MIQTLAKFLAAPIMFFISLAGLHAPAPQSFGSALPGTTALFETSLASPITSSASSMTLSANAVRGGGSIAGYNCFAVDEGTSQAETICGSVSGTAVTALQRGISQADGTSTVAVLQFAHRRGSDVKITDFPVIQILKAQNNGDDTFPNALKYAPGVSITGSSPTSTLASVDYVNGVAVAGAPNASETVKGIVELATAAEAASGTSSGATGARLSLPASIATSTCQAAANSVLISNAVTGKLASTCLDQTANYTFSGANTFSATTTHSGPLVVTASTTLATTTFTGVVTGAYNYQAFTASSTWTKPAGLTGTELVKVQLWGAGGGGGGQNAAAGGAGGGGGGSMSEAIFRASDLTSTVTVTIGSGGGGGAAGTNSGSGGGNTTFGSFLTGYGGGGGSNATPTSAGGGGGAGVMAAGGNASNTGTGQVGGAPAGGAAGAQSSLGGGGGGTATAAGGLSGYGGGGGGGGNNGGGGVGGNSLYGGGGGGGGGNTNAGGTAVLWGGNGGTGANSDGAGSNGTAPGGGGGGGSSAGSTAHAGGNGARGEARIWIMY